MPKMLVYTTLTQLKMAMNNGIMPPMTPIPEDVQQYIDPGLTIGLGALSEDRIKGLRCPVRDCGQWSHYLTQHLNKYHAAIGGAEAVKKLLQIPVGAGLISQKVRKKMVARARANPLPQPTRRERWQREHTATATRNRIYSKKSMGRRNLANACDSQLAHRLIDLEHQVGHSPSIHEAETNLGRPFVSAVIRVYGSWNSAKSQNGLAVHVSGSRYNHENVIEALREFHRVNHRLPRRREADALETLPVLPCAATIVRALGAMHWIDAMVSAAAELGIKCEPPRVGGPRRKPSPNHPWRRKVAA